ncbi:MAG: hypothetical protein NT070_20820 [Cyanobacteria bacterium]|nr:hypothetical protein [Cyanobacteriota bacterium]
MKEPNLQFLEVPSQKKIIEVRGFWGQVKVVASWYVVWNTIHQLAGDFLLGLLVCGFLDACNSENILILRTFVRVLAIFTSIANIVFRMNVKARRRWNLKYS